MATASPSDPASVARVVVERAAAREPTLGVGRLVCIDGPGGSGKTTLAAAINDLVPSCTVIHMDDLYDGWSGLREGADQLGPLLGSLAEDRPGHYRRYDWVAGAYAETVEVAPVPLLVVEGVGSGSLLVADLITVLVWVEVEPGLRLARGLVRDGEAARTEWERWMVGEQELFAREATAERADVLVDGTSAAAPRLRW